MKKGLIAITALASLLVLGYSAYALLSTPTGTVEVQQVRVFEPITYPNHIEFNVFPNDSIGDLEIALINEWWDTTMVKFTMEVLPFDMSCLKVVWDSLMYQQKWDTLNQTIFWRMVMNLGKDSAIINLAHNREIIDIVPLRKWEALTDTMKEDYRDSVRLRHELAENAGVFVTPGKRHYYEFKKMLPHIAQAVQIFEHLGVDPWYAQAILLIESPGKLQYSPVGAYGSFQLMENVATEYGLIVNDSIDEREDFPKAAQCAAALLKQRCVAQTRYMLRKREIPFQESDLWFRLLVLHSYHAGAGNVAGVLDQIAEFSSGPDFMKKVWQTEYKGFKNASQNYSQVALASLLELDVILQTLPDSVCHDTLFLWREEEIKSPEIVY
ncbi:MAG: transglycosylase SLT domain-containing protein [Bacteroidota bacterium]